MASPATLSRCISPPPRRKDSNARAATSCNGQAPTSGNATGGLKSDTDTDAAPTLAAVEAGQAQIRDHLEYFTEHFRKVRRTSHDPSLAIEDFERLFKRNEHRHGRHFVVHQHDHPVSGISRRGPSNRDT